MKNQVSFFKASEERNEIDAPHPAYYFRQKIEAKTDTEARLRVAVSGLYELFLNGEKITRGFLSPYFSNPNDAVYCDSYEIKLPRGESVIGLMLGNGFHNNPGGYIWDFDAADFRSAPIVALDFSSEEAKTVGPLLTHQSAIRSDDYRLGEIYDARFEIDGWACPGLDESDWNPAIAVESPKGAIRDSSFPPIIKEAELSPISITEVEDGYIYDFGECNAGVCRLKIKAERGRKIELRHADWLKNGDLDLVPLWFKGNPKCNWERDSKIVHRDVYVCRGNGEEIWQPSFTYHGFRYVKVSGIKKEEATASLLTYLIYHTELRTRADFVCSDPVANKIQEITRRSIISNFHHFPTDCPQREKNGWTADAALSSEAALLNFNPERNYREWMFNIRAAQKPCGSLPGCPSSRAPAVCPA